MALPWEILSQGGESSLAKGSPLPPTTCQIAHGGGFETCEIWEMLSWYLANLSLQKERITRPRKRSSLQNQGYKSSLTLHHLPNSTQCSFLNQSKQYSHMLIYWNINISVCQYTSNCWPIGVGEGNLHLMESIKSIKWIYISHYIDIWQYILILIYWHTYISTYWYTDIALSTRCWWRQPAFNGYISYIYI